MLSTSETSLATQVEIEKADYAGETRDAVRTGALVGAGVGTVIAATGIGLGVAAGVIAAPGILTAALVVAGGALIGGTAGGVYKFEKHLEYSTMGLKPPPITIKRLDDEVVGEEKHTVLELSNIKIIDTKLINEVIKKQISCQDDPHVRVVHDFTKQPTYAVKIVLKRPGITLAELDYSKWKDNPDFEIQVTITSKDGKTPLSPPERASQAESDAVLNTLGGACKFLGDALQHPEACIEDEMAVASNYKSKFGFVGGMVDALIDRAKGQSTKLVVDPGKPPSEILQTDEFLAELADTAIRTGNYRIFEGYEEAIKGTYETSTLTEEARTREKLKIAENNPFASKKWLIICSVALAVTITVAVASIVAPFLLPAAAATAFAVMLPVVLTACGGIAIALASVATAMRFFLGKADILKKEVDSFQPKKKALEDKLKKRFEGLQETKDALLRLTNGHGNTLELANKGVGNSSLIIAGRWMLSDAAKFCHEFNFSGNQITDEGAIFFAKCLATAPNIFKVNLSGNSIGKEGEAALSEAIEKNITLTTFTLEPPPISDEARAKIEKQLLINKFIQGQLEITAEAAKIDQHFGGKAGLQEAALNKIKISKALLPSLFIERLSPEIGHAVIKRQLELLFVEKTEAKDQKALEKSLIAYIDIYQQITPQQHAGIVNQKIVLFLIKKAMFAQNPKEPLKIRRDNPGLEALRNLAEPYRTDLFTRCLAAFPTDESDPTNQYAHGVAAITSRLMNFDGVFDPKNKTKTVEKIRGFLEKMADWDTTARWSFAKYIKELKLLQQEASLEDAAKIEVIIQAGYQANLEYQFKFLNTPYGHVEEKELEEFKAAVIKNTDLKTYVFPTPNGIDPTVQDAIDNAIKRNKILEIINHKPTSLETLQEVIEVYKTMSDPTYLTIPPLDSTKLAALITLDIPQTVNLMQQLPEPTRRALLELCYQEQGKPEEREHYKDKALLVSIMMGDKEFLARHELEDKPEDILKWAFEYYEVHSYEDLMAVLTKDRFFELSSQNPAGAEAVDRVLQAVLQIQLESKFKCLTSPFRLLESEGLKKELASNFDLRSFDFSAKNTISAEVRRAIEETIARNKSFDSIYSAQFRESPQGKSEEQQAIILQREKEQSTKRLDLFVASFSNDPEYFDKYIEYLRYRIKIDTGNTDQEIELDVIDNLRELLVTDITQLARLEEPARIKWLTKCFAGENDAEQKAAFVSGIVGHKEFFQNEELSPILLDILSYSFRKDEELTEPVPYSNNDLQGFLVDEKKEALQAGNKELAVEIDRVLQTGLQAVLKSRHSCLRGSVEPTMKIPQELIEDLEQNVDLTFFDFVDGTNPKIKTHIQFICNRNKMYHLIEQYRNKKDKKFSDEELKEFMTLYSGFSEEERQTVFKGILPTEILQIMSQGVGKHTLGTVYGATINELNCTQLRELQKTMDPIAFVGMLRDMLTLDPLKSEEAKEKAKVLADLLAIDALYDITHPSNDPVIESITSAIYWSMVPWKNTVYDLNRLKTDLGKAIAKYGSQAPADKQELVGKIQQAIAPKEVVALEPRPDALLKKGLDKSVETY